MLQKYGSIKFTSHTYNNLTFEVVDKSLILTNEADLLYLLLMSFNMHYELLLWGKARGWIYTHINLHHHLLSLPLVVPLDLSDEVSDYNTWRDSSWWRRGPIQELLFLTLNTL